MKLFWIVVINICMVLSVYGLNVKSVCNLSHPSVCSLKYTINKLEKHQITDALKSWPDTKNNTSILSPEFEKEFGSHPLIGLFIQNQAKISSKSNMFTVGNLKNLTVNNTSV